MSMSIPKIFRKHFFVFTVIIIIIIYVIIIIMLLTVLMSVLPQSIKIFQSTIIQKLCQNEAVICQNENTKWTVSELQWLCSYIGLFYVCYGTTMNLADI